MRTRQPVADETAIAAVQTHGALLVYPVSNREEPPSLWSVLHPGVDMRWAWDEGAAARGQPLAYARASGSFARRDLRQVVIFEDLWDAAEHGPSPAQLRLIERKLPATGHFAKHLRRLLAVQTQADPDTDL